METEEVDSTRAASSKDVIEENYLKNDKLVFEIHVEIDWTDGVYKDDLRDFGEKMKPFSDVVLVINGLEFNVLKLYLAAHSSYFNSLFLGQFQEAKQSVIELTGIDISDFQNYLELLYGEQALDEFTVEGILMVADMYDTPLIIRKCEEFLLKESKKTLKKKLQMSTKYHLESLKVKCLDEIKTLADIKAVLPGNLHDLDPSIMAELLEKSIAFR